MVSAWYLDFFQVLDVLCFHILNLIFQFMDLLMDRAAGAAVVVSREEEQRGDEGEAERLVMTAGRDVMRRKKVSLRSRPHEARFERNHQTSWCDKESRPHEAAATPPTSKTCLT
ncbi:hypothetical protein CHARACLAT_013353 [Characodon lateralis]|uniref:Uncharacterized protein n=1 Tax=Characodon lateralis TaxID=208331 RepID=A0ABU7DGG7_9TELE|nr:hypothetical protein [Characodon lateralis]